MERTFPIETLEQPAPEAGTCLVRGITLRTFLSFAPDTLPMPMQTPSVPIGPNGCDEAKLTEGLALMRPGPRDFREALLPFDAPRF